MADKNINKKLLKGLLGNLDLDDLGSLTDLLGGEKEASASAAKEQGLQISDLLDGIDLKDLKALLDKDGDGDIDVDLDNIPMLKGKNLDAVVEMLAKLVGKKEGKSSGDVLGKLLSNIF
ncbi:MAG: hypothetical protein Q4B96_03465 [Bacillota bacterium]|nr:hypothetical protein [Bacillota bacterium]